MPVTYISGDPALTRAQVIAFGHNALGRTELGALETDLFIRYPAAFSAYRRQCQSRRIRTGALWLWYESVPMLAFLVVRESSVGATRLRFVQSAVLMLAREYHLLGIKSLALAPLGTRFEWPAFRPIIDYWLGSSALPVYVYDAYLPGVQAAEPI